MKNLLFILMLATLFTSCKEDKIEPVASDSIENTVWTKFDHESEGKKVYKVITFGRDSVKVSYNYDKTIQYVYVGMFEYKYSDSKVWIRNGDNTLSEGVINDKELYLGGEILIKE